MRAILVGVALVMAVTVVAARPASAKPTEAQLREAEERYQRGQTHYDLGEFDAAVAEFKAAYELSRAPELLFNIAQAYRLAKNYEQAIFFYRSYLRSNPPKKERELAEQRIAEMEQVLRDAGDKPLDYTPKEPPDGAPDQPPDGPPSGPDKQAHVPPPDLPPDGPPPDLPPPREPSRPGFGLKIGGLVTGLVGIALIGAGAYTATLAAGKWDDVNAAAGGDAPWTAVLQGKYDDAQDDERTATILFVAGGVAVASGVTLYILGVRQAKHAPRVGIAPTPTGVSVGVAWDL